jgi:hypothetical protein
MRSLVAGTGLNVPIGTWQEEKRGVARPQLDGEALHQSGDCGRLLGIWEEML